MILFRKFKDILRGSPVVRAVVYVALFSGILGISLFIGKKVLRPPVIISIEPELGSPGDIMIIKGKNFGSSKGSSYVSISGSKITESGYLMWTDREIQVKIPMNVRDGLVVVGNSAGKSYPSFFANQNGIPVLVRSDPETTIPVITSMSQVAGIGNTITISGKNFGSVRGISKVFFTANREDIQSEQMLQQSGDTFFIPAGESDFDYVAWDDAEIRVRVPDGAATGPVYVMTDRGSSSYERLTVPFNSGKKSFYNKRTYVIQTGALFDAGKSQQEGLVTLYMPRPCVSASQPSVSLNDCVPEPLIKDDAKNVIFQKQINPLAPPVQRYSQSYVVSVYSVASNVTAKNIATYRDTKSRLYLSFTAQDPLIPAKNETVISLMNTIVGKETNPYRKAYLIYDYMLKNYSIEKKVRTGNVNALELLRRKTGDAYDWTVVFCSLCRAAGIPCVPVSGIIALRDNACFSHWWAELYFENFGWFPVDPALGRGMEVELFVPIEDSSSYYFGNMDSQHIAFSRGWNQIKASLINSSVVSRTRTYALQSVWEEATASSGSSHVLDYECKWNEPVITGIY
ncbi:MAG: IPT/TIG domain-containing protein [Treponema sp.]|nr:IPT/TIG domain-containing protein [Treponema sp.]